MQIKDITPRIWLAIFIIPLGIIIAAVPENTTKPYKLSAEELLVEVQEGYQYITTDEVADKLVQKDPSVQLIDVRSAHDFEQYHLPGAINIPLSDLLSDENVDYIDQGTRLNIFYSNGTVISNEAWMITRQLGYENNYVLQGGLNYWVETIMNPQKPASTSPNDEFAKYDFRKAAGSAIYGGSVKVSAPTDQPKTLPKVKRKKKKKGVQGGC
jgi:rhodanese-related sulfurtransferase